MSEPTGRELDAEVAEKVMGWVDCQPFVPTGIPGDRVCVGRPPHVIDGKVNHCASARIPDYSTDIAAAWTVHQKACEWLFSKRRHYLQALQNIASEALSPEERKAGRLVAWESVLVVLRNRMPESICRAALSAAGGTGG
jgi:hypothetical protein